MAPPPILSSPLLTLSILDQALSAPLPPSDRIPLLSAKIHLLSSPPAPRADRASSSTPVPDPSGRLPLETEIRILECRLDLARAHLALVLPGLAAAESELMLVEGKCKGLMKRKRRHTSEHEASTLSSADTPSAPLDSSSRSIRGVEEDPPWSTQTRNLRIQALEELIKVEERLGREGRRKRWAEQVAVLQQRREYQLQ